MGLLDFFLGNKRRKPEAGRNTDVAKGIEIQSDDERDASRQRMEDEVNASRTSRESNEPAKE